jgi:hypothetical protein
MPSADVGKRDLPAVLRSRFTELWVGEPAARGELAALAAAYLADAVPNPPVDSIVDFYLAAKAEAVSACGAVRVNTVCSFALWFLLGQLLNPSTHCLLELRPARSSGGGSEHGTQR